MAQLSEVSAQFREELVRVLDNSPADWILYYLATSTMKMGGHRYGAFLDAATTAAKLAIYSSYQEQGANIRKNRLSLPRRAKNASKPLFKR